MPDDGPSAYYLSANRGKRSLALDLEHSHARAVLDDLIRAADVLVENFLPRVRDKLGLSPARLAELNPKLNAIVFSDYDRARATRPGKGVFAGVPMLLKDMRANVVGWPTRSGSRAVPAAPASVESTIVTRFKAAGLVPFGKTNVPEFGILPTTECRLYGPAHNPWNLAHSPGGS